MKKNGFTLIEMLVVIAIIGILAAMLSGPLMNARTTALKAACTNNLKGVGTANFQYESPSYFDKAATGNHDGTAFSSDANTTLPICALFAAGLLENIKSVSCPVGSGPAIDGDGIIADSDSNTGVDPYKKSSYAFTLYYKKGSKSNRVIAGDIAGKDQGYSPNHGDTTSNKTGGGGASALFKDNHIKASSPSYTVEGAQNKDGTAKGDENLWDGSNADSTDCTGTAIGKTSADS